MEIEGIELNERTNTALLTPDQSPLTDAEKDQLDRIQSVAKKASGVNPGLKAVQLAMLFEKNKNREISDNISKASNLQKSMEELVDLNGKLALYSENETEKTITPEIREIFQKLKAKGLDILPEKEMKLSRERLAEVKATISAHTDRIKTDLQVLFTAVLGPAIQTLQSVMDCAKRIEEYTRSTRVIQNIKPA